MPGWSAVLLLPVAGFVAGWLVVRQFVRGRLALPLAFAALALGLAAVGWLALVLAELGLYSAGRLALAWLALVVALLALDLWRGRTGRGPTEAATDDAAPPLFPRLPRWSEPAFLALWAVAAGWLFFRPHEYMLGAADAGVYVSIGASIAREGSIVVRDEALAALDEALYPTLLRPQPDNPVAGYYLFPGFYVDGEPTGEITPQFYPLHPVWQAVAYSLVATTHSDALAGTPEAVRAALLINGLWATLGCLAVYLTARQFAGRETAALALVALSATALQVWFARYPTTEMLTQYLLWTGLCALGMWLGPGPDAGGRCGAGRLWALVAGVSLGLVYLTRVDLLALLPVLALLALWLLAGGRRAAEPGSVAWFLIPLVLLIGHSFAHAWWQSRPYFVVHSGLGLRLLRVNWAIPVVGVVITVAFLWWLRRAGPRFIAGYGRYRRYALLALIAVTLVFAVYGWFIRPVLGAAVVRPDPFSGGTIPLTDHENWRRLGWYLSPVGVWLGVAGVCLLIWRVSRRTALVLATGALFAALYLWSLRANPHQVYAMRRFVPAAAPFFTIAAAALLGWLAGQRITWARVLGAALAVLWLAGLGWSARGFVSQVDNRGLAAQLDALNAALAPHSILLFYDGVPIGNGDFFGTPLQFIYGHSAFALRDPALPAADLVRAIEIWHNSGRAVYWIGDPTWLVDHDLPYRETTYTLESRRLEENYQRKPSAILRDVWTLRVAGLYPAQE